MQSNTSRLHLSTGSGQACPRLTLPDLRRKFPGSFGSAQLSVFAYEKNIPTEQDPPRAYSRFPCPYGDTRGTQGTEQASGQRPRQALPLTPQQNGDCGCVTGPSKAFTRSSRLTASREYEKVFGKADRSSDRFFTVLARANDVAHPRLGLAISRRVAPSAVDRNRLRRLAREAFRVAELAALDFVVMASKEALIAAKPELRTSLDRHFERLSRRATAS